jgi:hypothetical protein
MIEVEKCKMITEQSELINENFNEIKLELERNRAIIYNGEKQVREMEQYIFNIE